MLVKSAKGGDRAKDYYKPSRGRGDRAGQWRTGPSSQCAGTTSTGLLPTYPRHRARRQYGKYQHAASTPLVRREHAASTARADHLQHLPARRRTHLNVDGERHDGCRDEQVGHGQTDDEVVGGRLERPLAPHRQDDQYIAEHTEQRDQYQQQEPVLTRRRVCRGAVRGIGVNTARVGLGAVSELGGRLGGVSSGAGVRQSVQKEGGAPHGYGVCVQPLPRHAGDGGGRDRTAGEPDSRAERLSDRRPDHPPDDRTVRQTAAGRTTGQSDSGEGRRRRLAGRSSGRTLAFDHGRRRGRPATARPARAEYRRAERCCDRRMDSASGLPTSGAERRWVALGGRDRREGQQSRRGQGQRLVKVSATTAAHAQYPREHRCD